MRYETVAGRSLVRLAALSDGVFAIAMTLLVLDLKVPAATGIRTSDELWRALFVVAPRLLTYVMSFLTLGIFWLGQQAQLEHFEESDKRLTWIHVAFLLMVAIMPFSTALLSEFIEFRAAVLCYWVNLLLLGATLFASTRYAEAAGLMRVSAPPDIGSVHERRIFIFQGLYLLAAATSWYSTYLAIGALVILQLGSILSPSPRRKIQVPHGAAP